jgi:DNA-binding NtrC family response regulator
MTATKPILISSEHDSVAPSIELYFGNAVPCHHAADREECLRFFQDQRCEFAFIDIGVLTTTAEGACSSTDCLDDFWDISSDPDIVVLCPPERVRQAVQIVRAGACGYLTYPIHQELVSCIVESTRDYNSLRLKLDTIQDEFWLKEIEHLIKTDCDRMKKVIGAAKSVAQTDSTVLITGETGTGKGILANIIHQHSSRKTGPFVSVHCGALPDNLIESELFGHEKGSFTGALARKMGKFELANGGTLFLDEVGTMSMPAQIRLLKVLQERVVQRIGSEKDIAVDVRVIAAANRNLKKLCDEDLFRSDLYYRLNVFPIELPPLRERKEDIGHLSNIFLKKLNRKYGKGIMGIRNPVFRGFEHYDWPGNIRELENVIERAYVLETSSYLTSEHFPNEIVPFNGNEPVIVIATNGTLAEIRQKSIEEIEEKYLREKLSAHKGKINHTAEEAGITPRQLHKLMAKYRLKREQFRS